jgi:hypothetical protein|nr:hypothetical protein [uncultured Rhodopila sp.]
MSLGDYWNAAKAAVSAFKTEADVSRANRREAMDRYAYAQEPQNPINAPASDSLSVPVRSVVEKELNTPVSEPQHPLSSYEWASREIARSGRAATEDNQERYTREVVDPISGREYTVNVSPYSWGYKYEVRDNESGEVLRESNMQPNLSVAMEDAQSWIGNRHNEMHPGGFAADGRWIDGREDDDEMER